MVLDIFTFSRFYFFHHLFLFLLKDVPVVSLDILAERASLLHFNKRISSLARHCSLGSGSALHSQENHLFFTNTFDLLTCKDATDVVLDSLCCLILGLLLSWLLHFTVTQSLGVLGRFL